MINRKLSKILIALTLLIMTPLSVFAENAATSGAYVDPFEYWDGSEIDRLRNYDGSYIKDSTHRYGVDLNDDILNFNYGQSSSPNHVNILSNTDAFTGSYYSNEWKAMNGSIDKVYSKKHVKPTDNPNVFDVEIDIISGATQTKQIPKVDVVFVLDKSSSMNYGLDADAAPTGKNPTRWEVLVDSLTAFINSNLGDADKDIQMAFVSYGSNDTSYGVYQQYADVFDFGSSSNVFTKDANKAIGHQALSAPGSDSWTPTYLGVEIGAMLLESGPAGSTVNAYGSRNDAKKVLITLTDGVPSYVHTAGTNSTSFSYTNRRLSAPSTIGGSLRTDKFAYRFTDASSNTWGTSTRRAIVSSAEVLKSINDTKNSITPAFNRLDLKTPTNLKTSVDRYAIGFAFGVNTNPTIRADITSFLEYLGKNGMYSANAPEQLQKHLEEITKNIKNETALIKEGTFYDPMSPYVNLDQASIRTSSLKLTHQGNGTYVLEEPTSYTGSAVAMNKEDMIKYDKLTLGGEGENRHGFRINYQVTLKTEYQNGSFYPINGPTYLDAQNYENSVAFTVPSVRYRHVEYGSVPYEKIWDDRDNFWQTRSPVTLQLQELRDDQWVDVENQVVQIGPDDPLSGSFDTIPIKTFDYVHQYRVIETSVHPEYHLPSQNQTSITNRLKTTDLVLWKHGTDESVKLSGVEFTLYKTDSFVEGDVEQYPSVNLTSGLGGVLFLSETENLAKIPIGKYMLRETKPLAGYQTRADISFEVHEDLSITGFDSENKIKNELKDFSLNITKVDESNEALTGAEFNLKSLTYDMSQQSNTNIFTFIGLKPGSYELREVVTPSGYVGNKKATIIEIMNDGTIRVDGKTPLEHDLVSDDSGITSEGNTITLTIINQKKGILPLTGGIASASNTQLAMLLIGLSVTLSGTYVLKLKLGGSHHEKTS